VRYRAAKARRCQSRPNPQSLHATHPTIRPLSVSIGCVTDADLVARAKQGDHAAFGELVDRHRLPAYRAALTVLGSHAEADEVAQDAFVLAWQRLDSFRGDASFRTWLLKIAWHQAINRRRGRWRWWKRTVPLDDVWFDAGLVVAATSRADTSPITVPGGSTGSSQPAYAAAGVSRSLNWTPEQLASSHELRRDIATAIRALSPKLRDTFLLAQSGQYGYDEIGALLGVPVGTIKWRVAEARRLVKIQLQGLGHEELG
jgi:RNA polymerase sigma-70 factor (ECF subfamily)